MIGTCRRPLRAAWFTLACVGALSAAPAKAEFAEVLEYDAPGHWRIVGSPYTLHWNPNPEHKHVWAVAVERQRDDGWLYGASYFSNSFGQDSGYWYVGKRYLELWDRPQLFWQWTAGLLYGYKGAYANKVPLNYKAFSPGAVVSIGWQFDPQLSAQINAVGTAGLMLQFSYDFR
jgi:hypothetical protein